MIEEPRKTGTATFLHRSQSAKASCADMQNLLPVSCGQSYSMHDLSHWPDLPMSALLPPLLVSLIVLVQPDDLFAPD